MQKCIYSSKVEVIAVVALVITAQSEDFFFLKHFFGGGALKLSTDNL